MASDRDGVTEKEKRKKERERREKVKKDERE